MGKKDVLVVRKFNCKIEKQTLVLNCEPEQPLALGQRDKPGAYFVPTGTRTGNKGGDVKRAGASARTSAHDRPIFMSSKRFCWGSPRGVG